MIDLSNAVFSAPGAHICVFAMHENAANANRGKIVDKNTGRVISDAGLKPGIYLRSFIHRRDYETNLFRLHTGGEHTCPEYTCLPQRLTVLGEGGALEMAFDGARTLLVRTQIPAQITCCCLDGQCEADGDSFTLCDMQRGYTLRFACVNGGAAFSCEGRSVRIDLCAGCTLRIDEYAAAPAQYPSAQDFDKAAAAQERDFSAFLAGMPKAQPGYEGLMELAAYQLWVLLADARGNYTRDTVLVSKNYMCGTWAWDHCFAAMALASSQPERAWDQLMCIFDHQREDGRVPDCIEAGRMVWGYVKPPIHGLVLEQMMQRMTLSAAQREEAYTRLGAWYRWWMSTADGDGLPCYGHGNDSGWDNATCFDQGAPVESAELCAYLIQTARVLGDLAASLGRDAEAAAWAQERTALLKRTLEALFVDGEPIARHGGTYQRVGEYSLMPYLSIVLGDMLPPREREAVVAAVTGSRFKTPYGTATEALCSPYFQADGYWRGSIWAPEEYLLVAGLIRMGEYDAAREEMEKFLRACQKGLFSECYNAQTGEGQRDRFLLWSACVFVLFCDMLSAPVRTNEEE